MHWRIVRTSTGETIATRATWARSHAERRRGLLGRTGLEPGEAMIFDRTRQVHTMGMSFPIDVVFCDAGWVVRHVVHRMATRRVTRWVLRARYVIEAQEGAFEGVVPGEKLEVSEAGSPGRPG
ncbi:MAG: DUF192 domain-containing protein [Actinomycetota bacterium]